MKNMQPLDDSVYSPSIFLYETNFPYKGERSIAYSIFKTCVQRRKDHFGLFLDTSTCSGRGKNAYQISCSQL